MSRFGIGYETFLDLTPRELYEALKDHSERKLDEVKVTVKLITDAIRYSTFHLINFQLDTGKKLRNPEQLWRYKWDDENQQQPQTLGEMKAVMKAMAQYDFGKTKYTKKKKK